MPVVFLESSLDLPIVRVLLTFRSGATHDPPGLEGLARLCVRMLRRGSEGLTSHDFEDRLDSLGGELSAEVTRAITSIHLQVVRRSLEPFLDLVARVIGAPLFTEDDLAKLKRQAVAEIIAAEDGDRALVSRAFRKVVFGEHVYGRPVHGTRTSVAAITRGDVIGFFRRHYSRENAVLAIAGDVLPEERDAIVHRLLGSLPVGEAVDDPAPMPEPRAGRRLVIVDKPSRTQTQLVVGSLGAVVGSPDYVPLMLANTAFGGTFSSRLVRAVRVERGLSYLALSHLAYNRRRETFAVRTAPSANDAAACLSLEIELLRSLLAEGITDDELAFAKSYVVRSFAFAVDTPKKRALARLEAELLGMPQGDPAKYLARVASVTREETAAAVALRIPEDAWTIAAVGSAEALAEPLARAMGGASEISVFPPDFE